VPDDAGGAPDKLHPLDTYELVVMHRSDLAAAPFYAKEMPEGNRLRLLKSVRKLALLKPACVYNRRTKQLVDGLQILHRLDSLIGTPNYRLRVAVVDLAEKDAVAAHIALNNTDAQGFFNLGKLGALFRTYELDLEACSFDAASAYQLFGDAPWNPAAGEALSELAAKLAEARRKYEELVQNASVRDSDDFFTVLVFRDGAMRTAFHQAFGLDDNRWQDGKTFRERFAEFEAWLAQRRAAGDPAG
jgi:hypothetical protein